MVSLTFWKGQSIGIKIVIFVTIVVLIVVGLFFGVKTLWFNHSISSDEQTNSKDTIKINDLKDTVNIHFVPHTHDDVGWLKTVDQYYYGRNQTIQKACVQCIIDNVIKALEKDRSRKFIYVETAFLWKWWQDRNDAQRQILRRLVHQGQMEIIGGGWSMNDEAVTHYQSIIDQFTWGFRRLNDMFGPSIRPRIGWQIDPFGHSREQASMFARMGFDGLFFARLDYQDKSKRLQDKTTEFVWKSSSNLGESSNLFTSVLFNHYSPPPGFCFDVLCQNENINEENVNRRVSSLLDYVKKQAKSYKTNNVLLTMGDDFHYANAETWFENMDQLIKYINENETPRFKAFYSTPSYYIECLNRKNISWTEKSDDFFPYASGPHAYWTGYYSSRPSLKYFERLGNNFLQVLKQLSVLTNQSNSEELNLFREAMGTLQHHDAITGTERQHVAEDYEKTLYESFVNGEKIAESAMNKLTRKNNESEPVRFHSCFLLNISSCDYSSENDKFVVTVYNPTSQLLTTYVRLPINGMPYTVKDFTGEELVTQIVPIPNEVEEIPGRKSNAKRELIFEAQNIPALSYKSFYVSVSGRESYDLNNIYANMDQEHFIGGEFFNISIKKNGRICVDPTTDDDVAFEQSFQYYEGHQSDKNTHSGAYVFRPRHNNSKELSVNSTYKIFKGPLVEEIHQKINNWISQVVRVYKNGNHVEFEWLVGPIFTEDLVGKEIISRYSSNLNSSGNFYTDSNGREMVERKLNYRPTWDLELEEPVAGNYYPVTTKISIQDTLQNLRLSVLTDRAQGGSSLQDGEMELMLHRRLLRDDGFGVGESLQENAYGSGLVVRGRHFLIGGSLNNKDKLISTEKELENKLAFRPWILLSPTEKFFEEWTKSHQMKGGVVLNKIPKEVRILTLEPWKDGEILLRMEHIFEKNETTESSTYVEIDLKKLFVGLEVESAKETTLGGNQLINNVQRLKWKTVSSDDKNLKNDFKSTSRSANEIIVTIKPMEIKTLFIKLLFNTQREKNGKFYPGNGGKYSQGSPIYSASLPREPR